MLKQCGYFKQNYTVKLFIFLKWPILAVSTQKNLDFLEFLKIVLKHWLLIEIPRVKFIKD